MSASISGARKMLKRRHATSPHAPTTSKASPRRGELPLRHHEALHGLLRRVLCQLLALRRRQAQRDAPQRLLLRLDLLLGSSAKMLGGLVFPGLFATGLLLPSSP